MTDHLISLSRNTIIDRLRVLQSDLTQENRHADALIIELGIQAIGGKSSSIDLDAESVVAIVAQAIKGGLFDGALFDQARRQSRFQTRA